MYVHRSNRTEELLRALADVVAQPIGGPFEKECIVVQDRGMERWLALSLSRLHGVLAHVEFPFPKALLERALCGVLREEESVGRAFAPEAAMWTLAELLPQRASEPGFEPIASYLTDDSHGEKALQLARRVAEIFDHYIVYRPEMVLAWERGDALAANRFTRQAESGWQAEMFRALVERHGSTHLASRLRRLTRALADSPTGLEDFPKRVSFFGIATLPPLYLSALEALSRHVEIHLFVLSPSSEYWGEIRSRREILRELRRVGQDREGVDKELALEEGNALLASLGRLGRDFQQVLESRVDYMEDDADLHHDPLSTAPASLLSVLQSDVLHLRARGPSRETESDLAPTLPLSGDDRSIRVHACHGPMREAEVLRDQLLDLFERDAGLEPRDVVVMVPDVEAYAPFIEAAFSQREEGGAGRVPCRVADRSLRSTHPVVEAFGRVLDVVSGRLHANEVQDLLSHQCIRARFGIDEDAERWIRARIAESGIRWGIDAEHRAAEGQPAAEENTWRFGLDRLLVGHAMDGEAGRLFAGVLPADGIEGPEAQTLGRFVDFCETLFRFHHGVQAPHSLSGWGKLLADLLAQMLVGTGEHFHEHQCIRDVLDDLVRAGAEAGYRGRPSLAAFREAIDHPLSLARASGGFLGGGVTVCELVPMRTIPFRVVCLMGLNDDGFPRRRRPLGFDLMASHRLLGDRSSRDDDRQLFLEALLSARDRVVITYTGQDVRDNQPRPPSVVVGELLDHLGTAWKPGPDVSADQHEAFERDPAVWIRERLVVHHAMQPFSQRYFDASDPELFSHADTFCRAARVLTGERRKPGPFQSEPLPEPADAGEPVRLDDLVDYFRDPARHLLRTRLRLELRDQEEIPPDREPVDLEGLELWRVGNEVLSRALAADDRHAAAALEQIVRARGALPLGVPGACAYDEVARQARDIATRTRALCPGESLPDLEIDLEVGGFRLLGRVDRLWPAGRVVHSFSKLGHTSEIELWIRHLALCALAPQGIARVSHLVGRPDLAGQPQIRLVLPENPLSHLETLLEIHRRGRTLALPILPRSSRRYVETLERKRRRSDPDPDHGASLDAYETYRGDEGRRGEVDDVWVRQLFGRSDPLSPAFSPSGDPDRRDGFRSLALRVFAPMLAAREAQS
jgi:exodeoxyribonuclease V gamma subunit